jgi:hypothetical protein
MKAGATACSRCGSQVSDGRDTCGVCGAEFRRRTSARAPGAKTERVLPDGRHWTGASRPERDAGSGGYRPSRAIPIQGGDTPIAKLFASETVSGVVLHVDGPHRVRKRASILSLVLGVVGLLLLPLLVVVALTMRAASTALSLSGFRGVAKGSRRSFAGDFLRQFSTAYFMSKLFGPGEEGVVRYIRIRDLVGAEHSVRMDGELVSGSISVGDDVLISGTRRYGTLVFRSGENRRTRSLIKVTGR